MRRPLATRRVPRAWSDTDHARRTRATLATFARAAVLAFSAGVATGCYNYTPLAPQATPAQQLVKLDITDRGRVALGDSLGGSVQFVEGRLVSRSDSAYVLSVSSVGYLNGTENKWSGERLVVRADLVAQARERRLARGRTLLFAGVAGGLLLGFIITRSVFGNGNDESGRDPGGNPGGGTS